MDVSGFDTSNVEDMSDMFFYCSKLTELDVSGFNTENLTMLYSTFYGCISLLELDLSNWDLRVLRNGYGAFSGTIPVIKTPANVTTTVELRAVYTGSDGNTYTRLPFNADCSILLNWTSESISGNPSMSGEPSVSGNPSTSGNPVQEEFQIIKQPNNAEAKAGEQATFTIVAGGENLSYQWQWSKDGTTWKNSTAAGYNTDTFSFTMNAKYAGRLYRCMVTNGNQTVYSNGALLSVSE